MKILFISKKQDACFFFRALMPSTHLGFLDHEVKLVSIEHQLQCVHCGKKDLQEVQISHIGDEYKCKFCFAPLMNKLNEWKQSVFDLADWADVVVFQRVTESDHLKLMMACKNMGKRVIWEADDDYINIPPRNSGYAYYKPKQKILEEMMRVASGITVTTESLKQVYLPYNSNIQVIPNAFDLEVYDVTPPIQSVYIMNGSRQVITPEQFEKIREGRKFVCWAGSPTHEEDLELVLKPLKKLIERENVLVGMGAFVHSYMLANYPASNFYAFGVVPSLGWYSMLKFLKPDVWLGPVVKNQFNSAKSNIKKIEANLMSAMFVGSDFDTYNKDSMDAFLCSDDPHDWFSQMRRAVNIDSDEKTSILNHNMNVIREQYDIKQTVRLWDKFLQNGVAE